MQKTEWEYYTNASQESSCGKNANISMFVIAITLCNIVLCRLLYQHLGIEDTVLNKQQSNQKTLQYLDRSCITPDIYMFMY